MLFREIVRRQRLISVKRTDRGGAFVCVCVFVRSHDGLARLRGPLALGGRGYALGGINHARQRMQVNPAKSGLVRYCGKRLHIGSGNAHAFLRVIWNVTRPRASLPRTIRSPGFSAARAPGSFNRRQGQVE